MIIPSSATREACFILLILSVCLSKGKKNPVLIFPWAHQLYASFHQSWGWSVFWKIIQKAETRWEMVIWVCSSLCLIVAGVSSLAFSSSLFILIWNVYSLTLNNFLALGDVFPSLMEFDAHSLLSTAIAAPGCKYQQGRRKSKWLQAATLVLSTSHCLLPPLPTPNSFWSCTYRMSGASTTQNSD